MLDVLFPKKDINTCNIWTYLDKKVKLKFKTHDEICYKCRKASNNFITHSFCKWFNSLEQLVICFYYTSDLKKYILNFKYYHKKVLLYEIWDMMNMFFSIYFAWLDKNKTIISYVPMHWIRKYFIKWYNQWELLANYIWKKNNIRVQKVCKKIKWTKPQAKIKNREKRFNNIKNSFWEVKIPENIDTIIIVDDVMTTWSTLEEMVNTIRLHYPNKKIYWLVFAKK